MLCCNMLNINWCCKTQKGNVQTIKMAKLKTKCTSYFVLLLSGKNYSVYYSTKYTSYTTLLRCATGCLIHFSACKMRSPAVSVNLSSPDESAISEHFTRQKIFNDNRSRRHWLLEKSAAVQRKTDDRGGTDSIIKLWKKNWCNSAENPSSGT